MALLEGTDFEAALDAVRRHAGGAEHRLSDDAVGALAQCGVNRTLLPEEVGGRAAHPAEAMDIIAAVGAVDGSAGWCTAISIGSALFAGYVGEAAARAMYANPDVGAAGMFAPMGTVSVGDAGAARMSGRWPFVSNCLHSEWIGLGAFVTSPSGETSPIPRLVIVPASDVTIEDTWHSAGLKATGSHHVRADDVEVDLDRSCAFSDRAWATGPLWRMPLFTVLGPVLVSAPLGTARGAIDHVQRRIVEGGGGMRGTLVEDPVGLAELAAADAALRAAEAGLRASVERNWAVALEGERSPKSEQARTALAVGYAMDVAVDAASSAHRLCGGAAAYDGHPTLTALRDVETARQHVLFAHQHRPLLMKIAAGLDEVAPPFVV